MTLCSTAGWSGATPVRRCGRLSKLSRSHGRVMEMVRMESSARIEKEVWLSV
jgi:hypothetical protein